MLKIKKVSKSYITASFAQKALDNINLTFRQNEFVSILGPSGSGKTTLLNIIGGLDRYDSGDLIINNKSTKQFKDADWDAYRNNCIGFVFQNYNLINHISVLNNVEMGLTLSGVSRRKKRRKALEVLKQVGLEDHIYKRPNQLSGGQMQRVAIARALANDPDIILADEPTGALDSKTSNQIISLISSIAKKKLVIMVTHNAEIARKYSNRIVELKDGKIISDSNKVKEDKRDKKYHIKKTAMSFMTALSLSFNNIKTKKGRTLLTALASSIGIIGISLVLALSNGFDKQIDIFEADSLSSFPILISKSYFEIDIEEMKNKTRQDKMSSLKDINKIIPHNAEETMVVHFNKITANYLEYLEKIDPSLILGLTYMRTTSLNILGNVDGEVKPLNMDDLNIGSLPKNLVNQQKDYLTQNYHLLAGNWPLLKTDLILHLDNNHRIDDKILFSLGIDANQDEIDYNEVLNRELKLVINNDYYLKHGKFYAINTDYNKMINSSSTITLKIAGIIKDKNEYRLTPANEMMIDIKKGGLFYTNQLAEYMIEVNSESDIVKAQRASDFNVLSGEKIEDEERLEEMLLYLGGDDIPMVIYLYPVNFEAKEKVLAYLDKYNDKLEDENKVTYEDLASKIMELTSGIMNAITYVLIAFSAISLIVSAIMIGIITYISVIERTKEIGILRSLGARKKDIGRVFNAETFIIGLSSGLLGIAIARILVIPANMILKNLTDLDNVARMNPVHILIMISVSILVTLVGGLIPSKMASKKDPVEALRSE